MQIHTLCVVPERQNCGIGSRVTRDVIALGDATGRTVLLSVLKSNPHAQRLYERLGFVVVGEWSHHRHMKHEPPVCTFNPGRAVRADNE